MSIQKTTGVFKGFLARAWRLCSNGNNLNEELDFLVEFFVTNGYNKDTLMKLRNECKPPEFRDISDE